MHMDSKRSGLAAVRILVASAIVASLAACATSGATQAPPVVTYDSLMGTAESQLTSANFAGALQSFESAAKSDPTRKEPWVRLAQLHFDTGNYGRAIVASEEVLLRDPTDKVAESVLTLGGFRIATQSLQRLQSSGALTSEAAQREARELAEMMRETMGPEVAGVPEPTRRAPARRRAAPTPAPAAEQAPAAKPTTNPFDRLGGN